MGALTPVQGALRTLNKRNEHPPRPEQVSLVNTARTFLHSVTNHPTRPAVASMLPTQRSRLPEMDIPGVDFTLGMEARRNARPKRVRFTTDCKFASGCSPPRLAATQLPSATGSGHLPREDLHLSDRACSQAHIPPAKPEAWKTMDLSKRLAVLDSSENIRMVFDYRAIVIPAALLSRNPADFRRLVYSFSQRFKLATDTFKGPDETQEPGFRPKHCRNDDLTPGNVKLCESAGRAGGLPCYLIRLALILDSFL